MKIKRLSGKLVLNKETITHLTKEELKVQKGGSEISCGPEFCPYSVVTCIREWWC